MDERAEVVDRVAEALFVRLRTAPTMPASEGAALLAAIQAYDGALEFYDERERRRGEWERQRAAADPVSLEGHDFQPAQGDPDTCLVCAKRRALHEKQGGAK